MTPKKRALFLDSLKQNGNVTYACKAAGVGKVAIYDWRNNDAEFAAEWDEAVEIGKAELIKVLEAEAYRRAIDGTRKPIYQQGKRVGDVQEYSDTLLIFLMKANDPAKYREKQIDLKGELLKAGVTPKQIDGVINQISNIIAEAASGSGDQGSDTANTEAEKLN